MAIGDSYVTAEQLKDYMSFQGSTQDARIDSVCAAVSREIEDWCHRQFNKADAATARNYRPVDICTAIVDDFFTTTGLIVATDNNDDGVFETTWVAADYELSPLNGVRNGIPGWPYWQIGAVGFSKRFYGTRHANLQVTAQWGWQDVPAPVSEAALMLAADTFQTKDSRFGVAGSDQFGNVTRVRDNVVAQSKLKHYVRQKVFVA